MARKPKGPRYFPTKKGYYVQLNGRRFCLAKGAKNDAEVKRKAWEAYHTLMLSSGTGDGQDPLVAVVFNQYLDWVAENRRKGTYTQRRHYLDDFCRFHPGLIMSRLTKLCVDPWVNSHRRPAGEAARERQRGVWGQASQWTAIGVVGSAIAWARENDLIADNPLKGLKRPPMPSRGRDCLITEGQHRLLLDYARRRKDPGFTTLLVALKKTGARPGELTGVTAADYRPSEKALVIKADENSEGRNKRARYGQARTIFLDDELLAMVIELVTARPEGPLFRNERGTKWIDTVLDMRFAHARKVLAREAALRGEPAPLKGVTPYSYRHSFATDWLTAGRSPAILAELLGTSLAMIEKHYGHLDAKHVAIRREFLEFHLAAKASTE